MRKIAHFFDRLEDQIRSDLSRHPLIYGLIGGLGMVLFWKGVWETADMFPILYGPASLLLSLVILLATGLLVSAFIGDHIIISGLKQEKKLTEKAEHEIRTDTELLEEVKGRLARIEGELRSLRDQMKR